MLYVVFSFVFIKYVNDRFFAQPRGSLHPRSHSLPPRLFLLSHPAWVTRSLQEVVPSFAVAKVYQIPNTNQILTRKSPKNIPQSCTHFPLNKTLTTTEKILLRRCNIHPLSLGIAPSPSQNHPRRSVSVPAPAPKATPSPHPKGTPRARQKGATSPAPKAPQERGKRVQPPHLAPRADA